MVLGGSNLWACPTCPAWRLKALSWRVTRLTVMTYASMANGLWAEIKGGYDSPLHSKCDAKIF